jgi:hypothetical protein
MHLYYRISDKSYDKPKLIGLTKENALMNFVGVFAKVIFGATEPPPQDWRPPLRILADRCERQTVKMLVNSGLPVTQTDLGNAGSLRKVIELAVEECDDDDIIYNCEDDYLHLPKAPVLIEEGIKRADYVTLYDHPDKYTRHYNLGEYSKVIKTPSSHWRFTISTCMTFAARVKTLKEDFDLWMKHTEGHHPNDHFLFTDLSKKGRRLTVAIPGAACHCCMEYSVRVKQQLMEPWAIDMMIAELESQLTSPEGAELAQQTTAAKTGLDRLVALDAIRNHLAKK